ncbi:hypothetical protein ACP70R_003856 [Stipagrostis hirtigluma subsp. patula]
MEPCGAGCSSKQAQPSTSTPGDVVMVDSPELPVESRPDEIAGSGALSLVVAGQDAPSQALEEEIAGGASASAQGCGHGQEAVVVADDASGLQITETGSERFQPIKDVQAMLQTGRLEGMQIVYRSKKDKLALSARTFAQHALKNVSDSHNPNDHIILCSSNISLFEACKSLKEVTNTAMLDATFHLIKEGGLEVVSKKKMPAKTKKRFAETAASEKFTDANLIQSVRNLEKRMESAEKGMENIQGKVDTIDTSINVLSKEMARYKELVQDLSKVMGKFVGES